MNFKSPRFYGNLLCGISILFLLFAGCLSTASLLLDSANEKYSQLDYRGAISDLTELIKIDPSNYKAYLKRGKSYSNLGNHD